jgi:hypothetical protein
MSRKGPVCSTAVEMTSILPLALLLSVETDGAIMIEDGLRI